MVMSKQSAFDSIYRHFVFNNNSPGYAKVDRICRLRGDAGSRCALGVLIPDASYSQRLEELEVEDLAATVPNLRSLDTAFLDDLRAAHDSAAYSRDFYKEIKPRLEQVAFNHHLTVPLRAGGRLLSRIE